MSENISAFRSEECQSHYFAAYDAAMGLWPVPFESFDVTTCYGKTHVNACGSREAPPLILLHGGYASSTMWFPNVADLSSRFRVFAVDTVGEPGKSFPTKRNATNHDCATWLEGILPELGISKPAGFQPFLQLGCIVYRDKRLQQWSQK